MTKRLLAMLPDNIKETIAIFKTRYRDDRFSKDATRAEIRGYLKGLRDAEIIKTPGEWRVIFAYMTI